MVESSAKAAPDTNAKLTALAATHIFLPRIHTPHMKEIVAVKTPEDSFGSSCRRVLASSDAAPRVGAPRERTRSREPLISYTFRKRGVGQHTAAMHNAWPLL